MSKIVSIHSFRGGTGKSNLTANLAAILASQGHRVGIVDTDVQSPGIHALFGMDDQKMGYALNDYLWGRCSIKDAAYDVSGVLKKVNSKASGAIYFIPSSFKVNEIARILKEGYDVDLLNQGFQDLLDLLHLDYLFIDTHPGINEETLLSITISDVLLVILRPDRQDFQGTAVTVDIARRLRVPKLLLVVNRALVAFDFNALCQTVEKTYKATVAGILPNCDEMMQLASSDIFSMCYPDHPLSQIMKAIAQQITV